MKRQLAPEEMFPAGEREYRVHYVRVSADLDVRVVESGGADMPPVMLLHGWGCSVFSFHKNIAFLSSRGFRVIAIDFAGHGLSSKPASALHYSAGALVGQIARVADSLGLENLALVGHSMGAALALRFGIANPRRITALGLLSPVGTSGLRFLRAARLLTPRASLPFWRRLNTKRTTHFFLRLAYGNHAGPANREVEEYWAPSQFPGFTTALRHLLHAFNWGPIYIGGLDAYRIPILVLSGSRDHLCRKHTLEHLRRTLRCEPQIVQGAGHLVLSETPDQVNAALLRLLRGGVTTAAV